MNPPLLKSPRAGFSILGLPDWGDPCGCIITSGGFERCPLCGVAGRTKVNNIGGAPDGFYEFIGHRAVNDSPHWRDHRLDYSFHQVADCERRMRVNLLRTGRIKP